MSQPLERASNQKQADEIRQNVRESYSQVAEASNSGGCCGTESSCCGVSDDAAINTLVSTRLGYSENDLENVPEGADMGLGCGNPRAIASIKKGEIILDLGSGGGFDYKHLPDPTDKKNLLRTKGRGIYLIKHLMDEVSFNRDGNGITMIKYFKEER